MISLAYAALWLFVFSVPWESVVVLPGVAIVTRATGAVALLLAVFAVVISARMRRWHMFHVAGLLFVVWAGFVLLVIQIQEFPPKYWTFVQLFLVAWMIWELAPSRERQLGLLMAFVFGAYVASLDTIMVYRSKAGMLRRFSAGGADANDLAATLALALPMAWYLGMTYHKPLLRWACRSYLLVGLIALGLTGSRGGMLASMVGLLIVPLTLTKLTPGRLVASVAMLAISGAVAVAYVPETLIERLATTKSELEEGTLHGRIQIWKAGAVALTQRPLMGFGTAGFKAATTPILGERRVAHNSYLSVMVEQGLVGFVFYGMMFVAVFLAVLDLPSLERRFSLVLLATLLVAMLPLTWEDDKSVWFVLAALVGLAGAGGAVTQPPPGRATPIVRPPRSVRSLEPVSARAGNAHRDAAS